MVESLVKSTSLSELRKERIKHKPEGGCCGSKEETGSPVLLTIRFKQRSKNRSTGQRMRSRRECARGNNLPQDNANLPINSIVAQYPSIERVIRWHRYKSVMRSMIKANLKWRRHQPLHIYPSCARTTRQTTRSSFNLYSPHCNKPSKRNTPKT